MYIYVELIITCVFCRYNPGRYRDEGDDSDMEANFEDIMKEEKRRFAMFYFVYTFTPF